MPTANIQTNNYYVTVNFFSNNLAKRGTQRKIVQIENKRECGFTICVYFYCVKNKVNLY